jgi:hypothetical protein
MRRMLAALACLVVLAPSGPAQADWEARPWVMLLGGYENSRLPDPDVDRYALPGGGLVGVVPGVRVRAELAERVRLDVAGQAGGERFGNTDGRAVLGAVVDADLRTWMGRTWAGRVSLAGNRYSDSARPEADRLGGGVEIGLGLDGERGTLELVGGLEGRRYDDVVTGTGGATAVYTESGLDLGLAGSVRAGGDELCAARVIRQRTRARDPLDNADLWLAQASVRTGIGAGLVVSVGALGQWRRFTSWPASRDEDSYWQAGVGLERAVTPSARVLARYALARVADVAGASENLHRATLAVTWSPAPWPHGRGAPGMALPAGRMAPVLHESEARLFRCRAPGARQVCLVGDFNGWDPDAVHLVEGADGWWQLAVRLPAGSHTYAYVVDGVTVVPADAEITVDDGFGGRSGLVRVEPGGP